MQFSPLYLVSKSPIRRSILTQAGVPFVSRSVACNEARVLQKQQEKLRSCESENKLEKKLKIPLAIAQAKIDVFLLESFQFSNPEDINWVLAADQVLYHKGKLLQKPESAEALWQRWNSFTQSPHALLGGWVLVKTDKGEIVERYEHGSIAHITFVEELEQQWQIHAQEKFETLRHSVTGYRLEDKEIQLIKHIEGAFFGALGLDLLPLLAILREKSNLLSSPPNALTGH